MHPAKSIKRFLAFLQNREDWLLLLTGLALALLLRLLLRGYVSGDAVTGSLPWFDYIESKGGLPALGHNFSSYPPLYLYMLTFSYYVNTFLNLSHLAAIKMVSIVLDFFGAYWFGKIVQIRYPGKTVAFVAALAFLFLPTVFMNGAMWGQIEGIFTSFLLASMYFLLKRRNNLAMVAFGLALSIKFQSVFMAPVLLILVLLGELSFGSLLIAPAVYVVTILPAWALGRPIWDLLTLYARQVDAFDSLTLNAPTLYAFFDSSIGYLFNPVGVVLAVALIMLGIFGVYKLRPRLNPTLIIHLSACAVLLSPYILPKIHERYFYTAEVFCLLLAFYRPRVAFLVVALQVVAFSTYDSYFFGTTFLALPHASLIMLGLIVWLVYDLARLLKQRSDIPPAVIPDEAADNFGI